jgi:hypothetical protein
MAGPQHQQFIAGRFRYRHFCGRSFCTLVRREMKMRARQNPASHFGWLSSRALPVCALLAFILCVPLSGHALGLHGGARSSGFGYGLGQHGGGAHGGAPQSHTEPAPQSHSTLQPRSESGSPSRSQSGSQPRPSPSHAQQPAPSRPQAEVRAYTPPRTNTEPARPGQQHLPEWLNNRQNLSPQQQEDALRREPGFRNLPSDQQQRLVNRLHSLDQKSPEQRQRTLQRNENFERLPPERQQEVRGASQALSQMAPERQQAVRRAFQQLRQMPPQQRQLMLSSGYASQFSPQERTVLGNLLSIEPYQARPGAIPQPYFGR